MKQPVNFRLNQRSMAVLESLVQSLGISKTQVVEEALDHYVQQVEEHQGHLVFQYNPDEGQSLYRLGSQPTASCRNIRMACPSEQANRGVT